MAVLAILDHAGQQVLFVNVSDDDVRRIEDEYDDDVECWVSESGLEERLHINMSCCSYMFMGDDDSPEIYGYDTATRQDKRLFLFS